MTEEEIFECNRRKAAEHGISLRKVTDSETVDSTLRINISIRVAGMTLVIKNIPVSDVFKADSFSELLVEVGD